MQHDLRSKRMFRYFSKMSAFAVSTCLSTMLIAATQTLTIEVGLMNETTLSGTTVLLDSSKGTYSNGVVEVFDSSATVDVTTSDSNQKFVASLNEDMPDGVELYLRVTGGRSSGTGNVQGAYSRLTSSTVDIITGMSNYTLDDGVLDFKMAVNENAAPITQSYTLSLVITSG